MPRSNAEFLGIPFGDTRGFLCLSFKPCEEGRSARQTEATYPLPTLKSWKRCDLEIAAIQALLGEAYRAEVWT